MQSADGNGLSGIGGPGRDLIGKVWSRDNRLTVELDFRNLAGISRCSR